MKHILLFESFSENAFSEITKAEFEQVFDDNDGNMIDFNDIDGKVCFGFTISKPQSFDDGLPVFKAYVTGMGHDVDDLKKRLKKHPKDANLKKRVTQYETGNFIENGKFFKVMVSLKNNKGENVLMSTYPKMIGTNGNQAKVVQ